MRIRKVSKEDIIYFAELMFAMGKLAQKEGTLLHPHKVGDNFKKITEIEKNLTKEEKTCVIKNVKFFLEAIAEHLH
jgi:hypothetical protein